MDDRDNFALGIVRGDDYGASAAPGLFMPQLRALGASIARVSFTWHQIEPEPGIYHWSAVDALLNQLKSGDRLWITVVTASQWATRHPSDSAPASMPRDLAAFQLFLGALISRCHGPAAYWQCNHEPSNPETWAGTAAEYAELATVFARTVRRTDPATAVILGGCGYDVLGSTPGSTPRVFFDEVLSTAGDAFDLFDIHLYDAPQHIPAHIEDARDTMRAHGLDRPVVVGEYGGPTPLGFPELDAAMETAFPSAGPSLESADLPPALQMFMPSAPPSLEAKRHRIACREIATRNLLAMASGVKLTLAWKLGPDAPDHRDPADVNRDKLALLHFRKDELSKRDPAAEAFARFAELMADATEVRRLETELGIVAIEVSRERGPLFAFWAEADPFTGEDEPPKLVEWPWPESSAHVVDIFGIKREVTATDGRLSLGISVTPLFVFP